MEKLKLGIVIPLKSKVISKHWAVTVNSLMATLSSVYAQDNAHFMVAVAGHEIPEDVQRIFPETKVVKVDFLPPDRHSPDFNHGKLIQDKNLKIASAMSALANCGITHWYALDSDDLLSSDFVSTVLKAVEGKSGAVIEGGYLLYHDVKRAIACQEMSQLCGSTSILADDLVNIPTALTPESIGGIPWSRYPHMNIRHFFDNEVEKTYAVIKKPILGYVLASGDNISDRWRDNFWKRIKAKMKPYMKGKKYSANLIESFSINKSN
ncbi:hypothetical protein D210916BOD24_07920 [Alteromonas sp. D210916BOD_24]|uniref:hypothetical protein n=1 Tax=Alteromonas sp. D210916BOD_24 TaxID=3157618 RepID=UPI00399C8B7F